MRALILTLAAIIVIITIIIAIGFNLNVSKKEDRRILTGETFSWIKNIGNNFKSLFGLTVKQGWLPSLNESRLEEYNRTNESKKE